MIEPGKRYRLVMIERDDDGYYTGSIGVTVTGRDGNLLQVNGCEVINMASPLFHSLIDEEGQRAYFKKIHGELEASLSHEGEDFT